MQKVDNELTGVRRYSDYDIWQQSQKFFKKNLKTAKEHPVDVMEVFPTDFKEPHLHVLWSDESVQILVQDRSSPFYGDGFKDDKDEDKFHLIELDFYSAQKLAKMLLNRSKLGKNAFRKFTFQNSERMKNGKG